MSNYFGWLGIFFLTSWIFSLYFFGSKLVRKKRKFIRIENKIKYRREIKGTLLILGIIFICLRQIVTYPGEEGIVWMFGSPLLLGLIILLTVGPSIIQRKINKITKNKDGDGFEIFYKYLWIIPGYFALFVVTVNEYFKDTSINYFINSTTEALPKETPILFVFPLIVAVLHLIVTIYSFFSRLREI
tara:strand:+ start:165 stop:725 length:561 start_codon:yes stop_codon:yes gene_type:complete